MFNKCRYFCYKQATLGSVIIPARLVDATDLPHRDFPERGSRDVRHLGAWNRHRGSHVVLNNIAQVQLLHEERTSNQLITFLVLRYAYRLFATVLSEVL
jgi:hypothetical protein